MKSAGRIIFLSLALLFLGCGDTNEPRTLKGYNHYALQKKGYASTFDLFTTLLSNGFDSTNNFFLWCCDCILYYATLIGLTYEELNLILFVFLQPMLILMLLVLYFRERRRNKRLIKG